MCCVCIKDIFLFHEKYYTCMRTYNLPALQLTQTLIVFKTKSSKLFVARVLVGNATNMQTWTKLLQDGRLV